MDEIYKNQAFWKKLTKKQRENFNGHLRFIRYDKKTSIAPYESDYGCLFIKEGAVSVVLSGEEVETELVRLEKNAICVICLQDLITYDTDKIYYDIAPRTEVFALARRTVTELLGENIHFELSMAKTCLELLPRLLDALEKRDNYSLGQKIISLLLQEVGDNNIVAVTHTRIASCIGASREAVTRKLREYAEDGFIECKRGSIVLLDKARLQREARF